MLPRKDPRMRQPAITLARQLHADALTAPVDALHPVFVELMGHFARTGADYLRAAQEDPNTLTDLRVRRDTRARDVARVNLMALLRSDVLVTAGSGLDPRKPVDHATREMLADLARIPPPAGYTRDTLSTVADDEDEVLAAMYGYVNVFGSWADALEIADDLATLQLGDRIALSPHTTAVAALLLLQHGDDRGRVLFEHVVAGDSDPTTRYFHALRWASIELKRFKDAAAAARILERARTLVIDDPVTEGMSANLGALLALRSGDAEAAGALCRSAVDFLTAAYYAGRDEARSDERARYAWMALLNQAQLAWFEGRSADALRHFEEAEGFAREHDPAALHSSLSTFAYALIQTGDIDGALPRAVEALDAARAEYDADVPRQIRKLILRCHLERGDTAKADQVRRLPPEYWRPFDRQAIA